MVRLTSTLLKYIPDWYLLQKTTTSYFKRQAMLYMTRFGKKREWSVYRHARNRYFYHLKGEKVFARARSEAKSDVNRARIAAACEEHGYKYNFLQPTLAKLEIQLNLSALARLAIYEPKTFKSLVDISQEATSEQLEGANFNPSRILSRTNMPLEFKPRPSTK